jgi:hypothetical protein
MRSSPDKLLCIWQHTGKNTFLSKGHNSAKNHSTGKNMQYAQGLELQINPVQFHWNCISGIREVVGQTLKIIKGPLLLQKSLNRKMLTICSTRLETVKFGWNCTSSLLGVVRTSFVTDGQTDDGEVIPFMMTVFHSLLLSLQFRHQIWHYIAILKMK